MPTAADELRELAAIRREIAELDRRYGPVELPPVGGSAMKCPLHVAPNPCGTCPYRRGTPPGLWHPDEYAKLPAYDEGQLAPTAETRGADASRLTRTAGGQLRPRLHQQEEVRCP